MRSAILICALFSCFTFTLKAQQFALYNTGTLYDSFENPSQKAFITDSSRHYAFNCFIPFIGITGAVTGPGGSTIKKSMASGIYDTRNLDEKESKFTKAATFENTYLLAFKVFNSVQRHRELGFSWQIRTDSQGETTNQTLIVFQNYRRIIDAQSPDSYNTNLFNTDLYAQSYHQFALTYRENYNKRFAYGFKLSYLSGIAYSKIRINSSSLEEDPETQTYDLLLDGDIKTSFYYDNFERKQLMPGFKNPGLAISLSANYKTKEGWYLLGNLKDLGFIRWSKDSYMMRDRNFAHPAGSLGDSLWNSIKNKLQRKGYTTPVNAKAEVLINKNLGLYQPNLILSKSLFYNGGDVALVNTLKHKNLNLSLSADYNLSGAVMVGGQFMIKSPNAEFYIGSDQFFKSMNTGRVILKSDETIGSGYNGASFYLGFSIKFGRIMSRWQNENYIPGINDKPSRKRGFLREIPGKKEE